MTEKTTLNTKIVILGEPAVGKTTLRISLIGKALAGDYMMTMGAEIGETIIEVGNVTFEATIYDIAGQVNFLPITRPMLKGTQGAVIVYDLTRDYTFKEVNKWLDILHEENPDLDQNIPFVVVGNKEDLGEHFIKIKDEEVNTFIEYANRHQVYSKTPTEHIKTSAKTGHRVREAFERLARIMIENYKKEGMEISTGEIEIDKSKELESSSAQPEKTESAKTLTQPTMNRPTTNQPIRSPVTQPTTSNSENKKEEFFSVRQILERRKKAKLERENTKSQDGVASKSKVKAPVADNETMPSFLKFQESRKEAKKEKGFDRASFQPKKISSRGKEEDTPSFLKYENVEASKSFDKIKPKKKKPTKDDE